MRRILARAPVVALACLASLVAVGTASAAVTTFMTGLDNPRGLEFGPDGALYVAEAGRGGSGPCFVLRGETRCVGATGAVSRRHPAGTQEKWATGLPSYAPVGPSMDGAMGPHDIAFERGFNAAWLTIGLDGERAPSAMRALVGNDFGRLAHVFPDGSWFLSTDISIQEELTNPDGGLLDSNPYGLTTWFGGQKIVADAGGNTLLRVAGETVSTIAVFPSRAHGRATDSVPTEVLFGPDFAFWVSELTGFPFPAGAANIYRVSVGGGPPQVALSGFKTVIDIAFGCDRRSLYVLQFATGPFLAPPGALIRVDLATGLRTVVPVVLLQPGGVTVSCGDGEVLYVSNKGTSVGGGEVLRIAP
jgi:hypothetical protein